MSPMYDAGNEQHYFIDEPAMLQDGNFVIPVCWLENSNSTVWFDAWEVVKNKDDVSFDLHQRENVKFMPCQLRAYL